MDKIQEIINKGWKTYTEKNKVVGYKKKVITSISECKTGKIGAHKYVCDECGYEEIAYNSCRNRHCPNCQAGKKLKWIEARKEEVLNIKYYHYNKKLWYYRGDKRKLSCSWNNSLAIWRKF